MCNVFLYKISFNSDDQTGTVLLKTDSPNSIFNRCYKLKYILRLAGLPGNRIIIPVKEGSFLPVRII